MFTSMMKNLFGAHVMHHWTEIDDYRYCDCGTLEQSDGVAITESEVKWVDVSKNKKAISEFKFLSGIKDLKLN